MADDEYAYLQPEFDPSSLTVPRLRSILVAHNVAYPSSAKKSDLIAIFNSNVAPQARKILNVQSRTVRSTRGIVDVPSSQSSTGDNDDDDEGSADDNITVTATPARRTTRRTVMRPAAEDIVAPTPRSTRKSFASTSARRASSKHATVEPEPTPRRPVRSSFPSEPPQPVYRDQGADSPFSKDNPFQSGSSPPSAFRSKSGDRRRTTIGPSADRERRKSRDGRRRTDGFYRQEEDDTAVSRMPVSRVKVEPEYEEEYDQMVAGEEFTPEEQHDLIKAQEENPRTALSRVPRKRRPRSGAAKAAPWTILLTMLVGVAAVWRQEKVKVGFCGIGEPSTALAGVQIPEWASFLQPECEPCPMHAECRENLHIVCDDGFVPVLHPLALGGLVPVPPTCEPDSDKLRKITALTNHAVETVLRKANAAYECGETKTPYVSEPDLKTTITKKGKNMKDIFELIDQAINDVPKRDEVKTKVDSQTSVRSFRSNSLAAVSFKCALKRSVRLTIRQHLRELVGAMLLCLAAIYGQRTISKSRSTSTQAKRLAGLALDKLAAQASLHAQDPVGYPEPLISMVALRDDVLRDEFRAQERNRIWTAVQKLVEGNANVRTMVREGRTGDVSRMWEWIGAVYRIEAGSARQSPAVNVPKTRRTYCKGKDCKKHTQHKVTQYKAGKASLFAQGKRRYDRKQSGYGGQTKPVFHKKAKTTKKVVLRLECTQCKTKAQLALKRCKHFELGGDKKTKGAALVF
ncbi:hypothetical protein M438DRAFT_361276 [Aureobasidium pullulans EXF-150]|uniref:Uncharacterized protein n=1 Tax=Aureobasidium pullulans EXF-150 TaxID=1043002 RepID=A0A074XWG5_AURPU|nr:uncharacterized protein M438DRAFT_361276 [Aureobasidium pullulans EXF-150]KEQ89835.1 hypothetical protein M438DRAFT_361276 [Aureobasidium pullulans EXF-150]